ncbi:MAG: DRTGG domain-containing protein [Dehalococcoidia bacterium]|nr:DRTGG domain-containing protein [Dehalococcoidia bacterium]
MPVLYVTASEAGAGKTGVAVAIARHYAYQGIPTKLVRFTGEGRAESDGRCFASLPFVPGSPPEPVDPASFTPPDAGDLAIIEGDPGDAPDGATVIQVARRELPETGDGATPTAVVVTDLPPYATLDAPGDEGPLVVSVPADRCLAGFGIDDIQRELSPEVLVEGEPERRDASCDYLVIAPIGSDAGQPYFRRFPRAAVVVRYDKTDMHLAAIRAEPVCLVLTGGRYPSTYTYDAAGAAGIPVYLSRADTENTILALEDVFDRTRFNGEAKVSRMSELLGATRLFEALDGSVPTPATR